MKNKILLTATIFLSVIFSSCGDPDVEITGVEYIPKLVVNAYLYPGKPVYGVQIMRNFPLNQSIDTTSLFPSDVQVSINGVPLKFNWMYRFFYHDSIIVQKGMTYTLKASGKIDGKLLTTSGSTSVPDGELKLLQKDLGVFYYGDSVMVKLFPSTNSGFYAFSIIPDTATFENFAFENKYLPNIEQKDLEESFNNFRYQASYILNVQSSTKDTLLHQIKEFNSWFYSSYRVIVYAGDENFKNFVLTSKNVKEFDGNFHEPKLNLVGQGIGVFASALVDTLRFTLIRR